MKRSDRIARSQQPYAKNEPHYNTYYRPVGTPPSKKRPRRIFRTLLLTLIVIALLFIGVMFFLSQRADVSDLSQIEQKATYVDAEAMPSYTKGAFVAVEDRRFYKHHGVDFKGSIRAIFSSIKDPDQLQGGSTITQQLVKNYYYDNQQTMTRKLKEMFVAWRVEDEYEKDEILSYYLNNIFFGDNSYTIESAANYYFGTTTNVNNTNLPQITVLQSAILASKVNAPSVYRVNDMSPSFVNRTKSTLEKMKQQGYITETQYTEALQQLGAS
ncbi:MULTISPECIES: monofunctional peptidoglycan glycosyltransferase SgtB [unclassified Staphylococcus]|uniref:monofunctional peptidoglycan glycosyltransferase SgtB n=1 Tax=unclassified Staphylococcus TaxID=91994 RepID=UPI0021D343FD|nr:MULTISPECIES: monofunctional peptidoglycan glycosyltransferase SgtB [unclassified Staphylococcus]UXR77726.1 monofunctional peptidoglycan glycosyltransferase SgtB [Staphylococcus sp. IVB6227]UXR81881.1 monofunctional peptidoglycan glycosyltransferase SgtB [Staphylococcus sp. IVB6214]